MLELPLTHHPPPTSPPPITHHKLTTELKVCCSVDVHVCASRGEEMDLSKSNNSFRALTKCCQGTSVGRPGIGKRVINPSANGSEEDVCCGGLQE